MIPLLLLAIVLSAAAATYEFSPRAHAWVDDHVRAMERAIAAHQAADAHLAAARGTPDPTVAVQHAQDAAVANREAAKETSKAAETAKTPDQRAGAAQSAGAVDARSAAIADAMAKLGVGQCDVRTYARVTPRVRDALLSKLHGEGMTVTGDNPWDVDTHVHDVKLRAVWDPRDQVLKLIVTAGAGGWTGGLVCAAVWDRIDPIMKEVTAAAAVGYRWRD